MLRKRQRSRILPPVAEAYAGMMVTPSVKLVRPLGEGGMGRVWIANHLALRTDVVVKFIASELRESREAMDRFSREAAAAAQVKSAHVVQTFDHGVTDAGVPYIVMELLEGRDLEHFLRDQGKLAPELVVEIVAQLARALDRAHERGIVHRDIKPGNVFLCEQGRGEIFVKLLDFGIAKGVEIPRLDSATKTGAMIGSPFYMSPEQILGAKDVDARSDLWSVGVVAFEALTGRRPFEAETMGGLAIKIHSEPLPLPTSLESSLPPSVDAWFERACARKPEERFASARELVDALAAAVGGTAPAPRDYSRHLTSGSSGAAVPARGSAPFGAATDAGLTKSSAAPKSHTRFVMLGAIVVLGPLIGYAAMRGALKPSLPPVDVRSAAHGEPSATNHVNDVAPVTSSSAARPAESIATPRETPPAASASSAAPPKSVTKHVVGPHPPRPKEPAPPASSARSPAPPPANTGHDIF